MTNTVTAEDGRTLTITDDTDDVTIWLTDGRIEYIAIPSHRDGATADEYTFIPAHITSRKPGGHFTIGASPMITTRELASQMAEQHDITEDAAREGVDTYVGQLVDIDGDDATIADRTQVRNASGRLIGEELTLTEGAAEAVRESFAAFYA